MRNHRRDLIEALVANAIELRRARRFDESSREFEQALAHDPHHPGALVSYAMLRLELGQLQEAIALGRRATAVAPQRMSAHHVLGQALVRRGDLGEGIAHLRRATALSPDAFDAHFHLGSALLDFGDVDAAEEHLLRAGDLAPNVAAIAIGLGNLYRRRGNADAAIAAYQRAIALDSGIPQPHNNIGNVLLEAGDQDAAMAAFRHALSLDPDRASTWSNLLLTLNRSDRITEDELIREHRAFGRHFAQRITPLPAIRMSPLAGRRLKVGYVSSDFVRHAVALFIEPLLANHDRDRFEVHCFHNAADDGEESARIRALSEHFVAVGSVADEELAQRIRDSAIDILVDLNGHTAGNRLLVFQRKPAPVQVTWLGYLGTTGLATIDYRLTDARADPPGLTESLHTETLWRLPDTAWCYQPYEFAPATGPLPVLRNGHITFASTNAPAKVSTTIIKWWAQLLAAIPAARLVMIASSLARRAGEVDRIFAEQGVSRDRIEYLPRLSTADYLALYNRVDIALDSWPCAGGTTTCDALWMGVPVVTLAGARSFSRSGASLLASVGLDDLVAHRPDEYVSMAVSLANNVQRLEALRESLRERMRSSPLLDASRFARAVEAAYTAMAVRHAAAI